MNMQILALAIYNVAGERREVHFRAGTVNIITGAPKTGKSSIIDIVDYCLGRTEYTIASGVIKDNVTWYVLHIRLPNTQAVIGRPAPRGAATTSAVYLEVGGDLELPAFESLRANSNTEALVEFLTEAVGITANENIPPEDQSRSPLQATIRHAVFLLFQPQSRIADRNLMFYREEDSFIRQSIKDTLPYLLGATGDERYDLVQRLRILKRELRILEKRLAEEMALRGRDDSRATSLIAEAQNVGLLPQTAIVTGLDDAVDALRGLLGWTPDREETPPGNTLALLQDERERLLAQYRTITNEMDAARSFSSAQEGFNVEAADQKNRLAAIRLYKNEPGRHTCPLCESELGGAVPRADAILSSLADLERQMAATSRQRPRLEGFINEREGRLSDLRQRLGENKAAIEAVVAQEEVLQQERNRTNEQNRVIGRISLFLESMQLAEVDDTLQNRVERQRAEVAALEAGLTDEDVEDRLNSILQVIGRDMSLWAQRLQLEHSDSPIGFEMKNLTVVAHKETGPIRLPQMGSAENWMGYHVITHLALHKFFVERARPVPGLLILDQPTQAFYPPDPADDRTLGELKDEDREAVRRLFRLIFEVARAVRPNLQVIIMDHADLHEDWFQDAVIEKWRGETKLVPEAWYLPNPPSKELDADDDPSIHGERL